LETCTTSEACERLHDDFRTANAEHAPTLVKGVQLLQARRAFLKATPPKPAAAWPPNTNADTAGELKLQP
jgi:hypothetical protein